MKLLAPALMLAACITVGHAQQSVLRPPIGSQSNCPVGWGGTLTSPTLGNVNFDASGTAVFQTQSVTRATEPAGNTQSTVSLNASVSTSIGTITWNFSQAQASTPTSINANQFSSDFPATSNIYFTPEATISSQPGVLYRATSEVHLLNTNLTSFNPQVNESYTLASGPINFADVSTGQVVFTINATSIVVGATPPSVLRPPVGSNSNCPVGWGGTLTSPTLGNLNFDASGTAVFQTQSVTPLTQPAGNTQSTVSLNASVQTSIGTISWNFAQGPVPSTPTSINANQASSDFPATSDIYFTPEATISSQPGVRYKATHEVHLRNPNLTSFNPQVNESYNLASGPIDFADESTGQIVFTINATSIVVGATPPSVLRPVIGSNSNCPVGWGGTLTSPTLGNLNFNANGTAIFQTQSVTPITQPAGNTQSTVSLNASVQTSIGTISWTFFPADDVTVTSINANQAAADFPATSDIYFVPEATISSQPGVKYRATNEVHLQTTNLTSFNPQVNEPYNLVSGPIDFYDESTGQIVFTINATSIVVGSTNNGGGNNPGGGNGGLH